MTVRQKQCLLAFLGCYGGAVDGIWGSRSQKAAQTFAASVGKASDGDLEGETLAAALAAVAGWREENFWEGIRHFTREEFRCRCGGKYCGGFPAEPDRTLAQLLDALRRQAGKPAHISSGLRCPGHNSAVGGVAGSRHLSGRAADLRIEGLTGHQLLALAKGDPRTRYAYVIGRGPYVHVDVE